MIIYNVTVNVETGIEQEWLVWMQTTHIPDVLATGCFESHKILRLLGEVPEAQGKTYAIQYFATSTEAIDQYLANHAPKLRQDVLERYQDQCVSFRTLLEEV